MGKPRNLTYTDAVIALTAEVAIGAALVVAWWRRQWRTIA